MGYTNSKVKGDYMTKRLQEQLKFILEIDKKKIFSDKHIYLEMVETKMMQNTLGIWLSWHIY